MKFAESNLSEVKIKGNNIVLPNGLTVVSMEMPHIHTVEMAMFIRVGLRFENKENNGISHFLEHMMFRGNRKYPSSLILNKEFESICRELSASTMTEYTYYGFNPHISQIERAVQLFADFFTQPTFQQIDLEREIILEEHLGELNESGDIVDIDNLACQLLYPNTPLAMSTVGTESTIKAINLDMIREFFNSYYIPQNMILTCAGPVSSDYFNSLANRNFSHLPNQGRLIGKNHFQNSLDEGQKKPKLLFQYDSDSQIQLQICFRSVSYNHPDYFAACLIGRILDDGFTSRLQRALREDRGLAYSVECRVTSWSDTGTVDFDVTVRPEKVYEVTRILIQEIHLLIQDGIFEDELAHVKQRYFFDLEMDQDDPYKQIYRYGFPHLYSREISAEEEWEIVERISAKNIFEIAQKIFRPEKLNLIVVGPFTEQMKKEIQDIISTF